MIYLHEFDSISKYNKVTKSIYPCVESFVSGGKTYTLVYEDVVQCLWGWVSEDGESHLTTFRRNPKVGVTSLQQVLTADNGDYDTTKEIYDIKHEWFGAFDESKVNNNYEPLEGYCVEITSITMSNTHYEEPWVSITDTMKIEVDIPNLDSGIYSGVYEYLGEYDTYFALPE